MKKIQLFLLAVCFIVLGTTTIMAQNQRFAYVDTDYIMLNIPEYSDAQEELNMYSEKWEEEIKAIYAKVEEMYRAYQTESVLLPEDLKRKREDDIINKEQEAKNLQMKYFGPEGELYTKRTTLVQPIQEKVFNAIDEIAKVKNYAFVFDKAAGATLLYSSDKFDISDDVLDEISNVMQTVSRDQRKK